MLWFSKGVYPAHVDSIITLVPPLRFDFCWEIQFKEDIRARFEPASKIFWVTGPRNELLRKTLLVICLQHGDVL